MNSALRTNSSEPFIPSICVARLFLTPVDGAQAAIEFQKILDHRGIVVSDPIGALAHLQLARALALSGDKIKSKAYYQDFFTLWNDADRDIPLLVRAKSEYVNLN